MLRKLLKHDLRAVRTFGMPMLGAILVAFILLGCFMGLVGRIENAVVGVFFGMAMGVLGLGIAAANVALIALVIARYYSNLMTDEGYLSFTLPVTATEHISSKLITALLYFVLLVIADILGFFLLLFFGSLTAGQFSLAEIWDTIVVIYNIIVRFIEGVVVNLDMETASTMILFGLLFVFSFLFAIFNIYFSMTVAGMAKKLKVLIGIGVYLGVKYALGLVNTVVSISALAGLSAIVMFIIMTALYMAATVTLFLLTRHMLTKKLNLN